MKPLAFLECRQPGVIAHDEYRALLRITGLRQSDVVQIWLSEELLGFNELDYSAIIASGSPYGYATPGEKKGEAQQKIEGNLAAIIDRCLQNDFPYFGICFGLQAVAVSRKLPLSGAYAEDISAPQIDLTDAGQEDPIFAQLPDSFYCITGHSEALAEPLHEGVVLARSATCPIQAVRFGEHVYGVQFHPEINLDSLEVRLATYAGKYYAAEKEQNIREDIHAKDISAGEILIRAFVQRYRGK